MFLLSLGQWKCQNGKKERKNEKKRTEIRHLESLSLLNLWHFTVLLPGGLLPSCLFCHLVLATECVMPLCLCIPFFPYSFTSKQANRGSESHDLHSKVVHRFYPVLSPVSPFSFQQLPGNCQGSYRHSTRVQVKIIMEDDGSRYGPTTVVTATHSWMSKE